jgi:hypothetical protein
MDTGLAGRTALVTGGTRGIGFAIAEGLVAGWIAENLEIFNGIPGRPASFDQLDALLRAQPWKLSLRGTTHYELSYPTFGTWPHRVQLADTAPGVFEAVHELLVGLVREGTLAGVLVSRSDLVEDPEGYFERLGAQLGTGVPHLFREGSSAAHTRWRSPVAGVGDGSAQLAWAFVDPDDARAFKKASCISESP